MATYNDSRYIAQSVESVLNQTFKDWEFIIINDASTDNTDEIIKRYKNQDKRIYYVSNNKNIGLTRNLISAVNLSKGKFIARIDGDDIWSDKSKLQKQLDFMLSHQDCGVVGCFAHAIDISGKQLFEIKYPHEDNDMRRIMLKHCCLLHSCVMLRKSAVMRAGNYDTRYPYAQDYDLYLKLGKFSKFHNIPEFLVKYRVNPFGTTQTKYWKQMQEMVDIVKDHKTSYPYFYQGFLLWNLRKLYPVWFRGELARQIKQKLPLLHKLSGA